MDKKDYLDISKASDLKNKKDRIIYRFFEMIPGLLSLGTLFGVLIFSWLFPAQVAIFIISPVPGSAIFNEFQGYKGLSDLNFTPSWRSDYKALSQFRIHLYRKFLWWKLSRHPLKILKQCCNFMVRGFETKMEMVPYKAIVWKFTELRSKTRALNE